MQEKGIMQIVLNVDGDVFSELINKEIQDFPKDKIQEIIYNGLSKAIEDLGPKLFIREARNSYYSSSSEKEATDVVLNAARNFNLSPKFKELEQKMLTVLDENCEQILVKTLGDLICRNICSSGDFTRNVMSILMQHTNNN